MNRWSTVLFHHGVADRQQKTMKTYNESVSSEPTHVQKVAEADFPTKWGHFRIHGFETSNTSLTDRRRSQMEEAVAIVMGDIHKDAPLLRIHSQCLTGDVFGSLRCDCQQQLEMALRMIAERGVGILIYEQQEGRGIGLMPKLQAYALQDQGRDTVEANVELGFDPDHRAFAMPAAILRLLGVKQVRLLSNNPQKVAALEEAGIKVVERVSAEVAPNAQSEKYLKTKKEKMGHLLG